MQFDFRPFGGYVNTRWNEIDAFNKLYFMNQNTLQGKISGKNASTVFLKQLECNSCNRVFHKKYSLAFHEKTVHAKKTPQRIEYSSRIVNVPAIPKRTIENLLQDDKCSDEENTPPKKAKESTSISIDTKSAKRKTVDLNESKPRMTREERYRLRQNSISNVKDSNEDEKKDKVKSDEKTVSISLPNIPQTLKITRVMVNDEPNPKKTKPFPLEEDIICLSSDEEDDSDEKAKEKESFLSSLHCSSNKDNVKNKAITELTSGKEESNVKVEVDLNQIGENHDSPIKKLQGELQQPRIEGKEDEPRISEETQLATTGEIDLSRLSSNYLAKIKTFVSIRNIMKYSKTEIRALAHYPRLRLPDDFIEHEGQTNNKVESETSDKDKKEEEPEIDEGYGSGGDRSEDTASVEDIKENKDVFTTPAIDDNAIVLIDEEDDSKSEELKNKFMTEDVHFKELIDDIINLRAKMTISNKNILAGSKKNLINNDTIEVVSIDDDDIVELD